MGQRCLDSVPIPHLIVIPILDILDATITSSFHVYDLTMFQIETAVKNRTNYFHREKLIFQHFLTNTCNYSLALCDGCHPVAEPGSIWLGQMNISEIGKHLLMVGTVFRMDQKSQSFNSTKTSYSTGNNSSYLTLKVLYA